MTIGDYDKRVHIQARSGEEDALGNVSPQWQTVASRWGMLQDQSGRELYRAQQVDPTISAVVTMREHYDGLGPAHQLLIGERAFKVSRVLGADDRTPKRGQVVGCVEEV